MHCQGVPNFSFVNRMKGICSSGTTLDFVLEGLSLVRRWLKGEKTGGQDASQVAIAPGIQSEDFSPNIEPSTETEPLSV